MNVISAEAVSGYATMMVSLPDAHLAILTVPSDERHEKVTGLTLVPGVRRFLPPPVLFRHSAGRHPA